MQMSKKEKEEKKQKIINKIDKIDEELDEYNEIVMKMSNLRKERYELLKNNMKSKIVNPHEEEYMTDEEHEEFERKIDNALKESCSRIQKYFKKTFKEFFEDIVFYDDDGQVLNNEEKAIFFDASYAFDKETNLWYSIVYNRGDGWNYGYKNKYTLMFGSFIWIPMIADNYDYKLALGKKIKDEDLYVKMFTPEEIEELTRKLSIIEEKYKHKINKFSKATTFFDKDGNIVDNKRNACYLFEKETKSWSFFAPTISV